MPTYGLQTQNNFSGFMDSGRSAEFVLAAGSVSFSGLRTKDRFGSTTSGGGRATAHGYVTITLQKYAIGMSMIGTRRGFHVLNGNVYAMCGCTTGCVPQFIDGTTGSSGGNWSETSTTLTIRNLMISSIIDNGRTSSVSGTAYVILLGVLPPSYNVVSRGIRLYNAAGGITFDSSLMPSNARHIVALPTNNLSAYNSLSTLPVGGLPSGVKLATNCPVAQGRQDNYYCNMGIHFSSDGTRYGLRPNGWQWTTPWQSSSGMRANGNGGNLTRILYASDYF